MFQQAVDVFDIVQRVVDIELELRDDAQLLALAHAEASAQVAAVGSYQGHYTVHGATADNHNGEVYAGYGEVGRDAHLCDCDERLAQRLEVGLIVGLPLAALHLPEEDVAHVLLYKATYLVLPRVLHGRAVIAVYQRQPTRMGKNTVCCIKATPSVA